MLLRTRVTDKSSTDHLSALLRRENKLSFDMQMFLGACSFFAATIVLAYLPGKMLLLKQKLSPLEDVSMACSIGLPVSGLVYWSIAFLHLTHFWVIWPLAIAVAAAIVYLRRWRSLLNLFGKRSHREEKIEKQSRDRSALLLAGIIALGVMILALLPLYYKNLTWRGDGTMRVHPIPDVFVHIALANELRHTVPPQDPMFAGYPMSYHYGMDLTVAMFANATGLDVRDLTLRFAPTLFLILSMLTTYCFARTWLSSGYLAALVVFLVFFGEDFAFIPGWLIHGQSDWSAFYFNVPTVFSLFYLNPMLPGLGLLFAGLFCLRKYLLDGGGTWLFLSAFLCVALMEVKIFTALHLMASLGFTGIIYLLSFRSWVCFKAAVSTALLATPSVLFVFLHNRSGANISATFDPLSFVSQFMDAVNWKQPFTNSAAIVGVALPIYLIGCLGMRCLGVPAIVRTLIRPNRDSALQFLLAFFVLLGAIVTLSLRIGPSGLVRSFNNSGWFLVQSKYIAWLFAVAAAQSVCRHINARGIQPIMTGIVIAAVFVALSIPASVRHFALQITAPVEEKHASFGLETIDAMSFLSQNARPGDIVLPSKDLIEPVLGLTQCHVPIGQYAVYQVPRSDYLRRERAQKAFWKTWHKGMVDQAFLEDLGVSYLVIKHRLDGRPARIPATAKEVFLNSEVTVFKVDPKI